MRRKISFAGTNEQLAGGNSVNYYRIRTQFAVSRYPTVLFDSGDVISDRPRERLWQRLFGKALGAFRPGHEHPFGHTAEGPAPLSEPPGMTTRQELQYYEDCAARLADCPGAIVDLGCWMGATARALARGNLRDSSGRQRAGRPVHAFDRFLWEPWMDPFLPNVYCDYRDGESFLPEARRRLSDVSQDVELVQCDLTSYCWQQGPIKILLVDAMKTEELARAITERFFPSLVTGGILAHQDFKHFYTSWLHLIQFRLRDHMRCIHEVRDGGTVAFELLHPVTPDEAILASRFEGIRDDEVDAAFEYSMTLVGPAGRPAIAAAHIMHYVHAARKGRARELLQSYGHLAHPPSADFNQVIALVPHASSDAKAVRRECV